MTFHEGSPPPPPPIEQQPGSSVFELAPIAERQAIPLAYADPDFEPNQDKVRDRTGYSVKFFEGLSKSDEYNLSAFAPDTLSLIFHFAVAGEKRSRLANIRMSDWEILVKIQPLAGLKIIDYGSGETGKFVRGLRALGAEAYGIDLRSRHPEDIVELDEVDPAIHPELFNADIVTCSYVFGMMDPRQHGAGKDAGRLIHQLLKPGGLVVIFPSSSSPIDNPVTGMKEADPSTKTYTATFEPNAPWEWTIGRKNILTTTPT